MKKRTLYSEPLEINGDNDIDGCLGTYLRINPNLISPPMYEELKVINEYDMKNNNRIQNWIPFFKNTNWENGKN